MVTIRVAQHQDLNSLRNIHKRYASKIHKPSSTNINKTYIESNTVFIAEDEKGSVMGFCSLRKESTNTVYLDHIETKQMYEGTGVDVKLLEEVKDYCKRNSIKELAILDDFKRRKYFEGIGAVYEYDKEVEGTHLSFYKLKVDRIKSSRSNQNNQFSKGEPKSKIRGFKKNPKDVVMKEAIRVERNSAEKGRLPESFTVDSIGPDNKVKLKRIEENKRKENDKENHMEDTKIEGKKVEDIEKMIGSFKMPYTFQKEEQRLAEKEVAASSADQKISIEGTIRAQEIDDEDEEDIDKKQQGLEYILEMCKEGNYEALQQLIPSLLGSQEELVKRVQQEAETAIKSISEEQIEQMAKEKMAKENIKIQPIEELRSNSRVAKLVKKQAVVEEKLEKEKPVVLTEKKKMLLGEKYLEYGEEFAADKKKAAALLKQYRSIDPFDKLEGNKVLNKLLGKVEAYVAVDRDFTCTYGYNIEIEENVRVAAGCNFVDKGKITIGANSIISPKVVLDTAVYPSNSKERAAGYEYAKPIVIKDNVWLGTGSIIGAGVTIGENAIVTPGAVVVADVPANTMVSGNPAKVIRELE